MTHREISEALRREPGMPASTCDGEMVLLETGTVESQALDGVGVNETVTTELWKCGACRRMVVVRHSPGCDRVVNDWDTSKAISAFLAQPDDTPMQERARNAIKGGMQ